MAAPVIAYASRPLRKPFRWSVFVLPLASFCVVIIFYAAVEFHDYVYLGPPAWLKLLDWVSLADVIFGLASAIICLCLIACRFRSFLHLLIGILLATFFLFTIPFVHMCARWELRMYYKDPPYMRLVFNARGLGQSACVYAADHGGHFPPHPAVLLLTGQIAPRQLNDSVLTPYTLPTPLPPESAWATIASDVDAHSTFIYTAADLPDPFGFVLLDPTIILAYTKPNRVTPGHRILLFADVTTQLVPDADLARVFAASNAARAKLHLPPFTLDGPPPQPPR